MARAVILNEYGDIDVLQVQDVPDPVAGPGQAVVRVRAAGINPGEAKIRAGALRDLWPSTFPSGQGSDLAGVVASVGGGVSSVAPGDEVIGWSDERSSHATLVAVPAQHLTPKPPEVPWEVAGALFVAGATAWATVRAVGAAAGDTLVVAGAAGGVGSLAVQLARRTGATVIGLAGEGNHPWLSDHGVIPVTYGDGVRERIEAAAGGPVTAFIETVGPGYVELALALGVAPERIDTIVDFQAPAIHGVKAEGNTAGASAEVLAELAALIAAGELELTVAATYPLDEVRAAYAELEGGHTRGKIVLIP